LRHFRFTEAFGVPMQGQLFVFLPNGNVTRKGVNAVGLCELEHNYSTISLLIRPQRYVGFEVDACTPR